MGSYEEDKKGRRRSKRKEKNVQGKGDAIIVLVVEEIRVALEGIYIGVEYDVNKVTGQVLADNTMMEYEMFNL